MIEYFKFWLMKQVGEFVAVIAILLGAAVAIVVYAFLATLWSALRRRRT